MRTVAPDPMHVPRILDVARRTSPVMPPLVADALEPCD